MYRAKSVKANSVRIYQTSNVLHIAMGEKTLDDIPYHRAHQRAVGAVQARGTDVGWSRAGNPGE